MRAGQFSANFHPDLLEAFRSRCKQKGEKYTKVLEQLAKLYLQSDGSILSNHADLEPDSRSAYTTKSIKAQNPVIELENKIKRLEEQGEQIDYAIGDAFDRIMDCERVLGLGKYSKSHGRMHTSFSKS
ncbi:MAG TPA: hypothetical protein QF700_08705 [Prochlorococcus sp.]|nr:hypothetical protein [Prochlorococcus sp.]